MTGPQSVGLNRANWDLRYDAPVQPAGGGGGGGGFFGQAEGPRVLPGDYTVKVSVLGKEASTNVLVKDDPRIKISDADRKAQHDLLLRVSRLVAATDSGQKTATQLKSQLATLQESLKNAGNVPESVSTAAKSLSEKIAQIETRLSRTGGIQGALGAAGPPPAGTRPPLFQRLTQLYGSAGSYTEAPSGEQRERTEALASELNGVLQELNRVIEEEIPAFNRLMNQNNVPALVPGKRVEVTS